MRRLLAIVFAILLPVCAQAQGIGAVPAGISPPAALLPTIVATEELGDSKLANTEVLSKGPQFTIGHAIGNGYGGWFQTATNNVYLPSNSGHYAVGGTSSAWAVGVMNYPYNTTMIYPGCATNPPTYCANTWAAYQAGVTTGSSTSSNWVSPISGIGADGNWPFASLGTYSAVANPTVNTAINLEGDNDGSGIPAGDNPYGSTTIANYQHIFSAMNLGGKMNLVGSEVPRGRATVWLEFHACASCTSVTATNTSGFIASEDLSNLLGAAGASLADTPMIDGTNTVWSRVASCASAANTYTTNSSGVYTLCAGSPTNLYLTYVWAGTQSAGSSVQEQIRHAWLTSAAADFRAYNGSTLVDYGYPGALNYAAWPKNVSWDLWNAVLNSKAPNAANGVQLAQDGVLFDGIHPDHAGAILAAKSAAAAISSSWPKMTQSLAQAPMANNWLAAPTTGGIATFGSGVSVNGHVLGNMPTLMLDGGSIANVCSKGAAAGNLQIWFTGANPQEVAVGGPVNGGNISTLTAVNSSGVTSGSINCTSGAWTVTASSAFASGGSIIVVEDPNNLLTNGLLDPGATPYNAVYTACPTNFACTGNLPPGYAFNIASAFTTLAARPCASNAPPCLVTAAIDTTGTVTDADGTWPAIKFTLSGVTTGSISGAINVNQSVQNPNNAITAGTSALREGAYQNIYPGPNGYLYGVQAVFNGVSMSPSAAYTAPWGTTPGTQLNCTGMSNSQVIYFDTLTLAASIGFAGSDGTYVPQRDVTDLCPTTGMTAGTISALQSQEEIVLGVGPFSTVIKMWRNHLNIRTQ